MDGQTMTDYPRYIGHVLVTNAEDEAAEIARTTERPANNLTPEEMHASFAKVVRTTYGTPPRKARKPRG